MKGTDTPFFLRLAVFAVTLVCLAAPFLLAEPAPPPAVADDWSKIVPGDARFYVELRDLAEIRSLWQGLGIWQTVRELAERDTGSTSQPWQRRAEELLGLDSEDAISRLLGHRSALIASDSSQWNGGVVMAELKSTPDLDPLLKTWDAKQLADEGPVKRYQLGGGILLAVLDRTLVLGPADDPDGLWGRTVLLLGGRRGPSLAARSDYGALRSRLSAKPQALLYSAWPRGDAGAFQDCTRLLAAAQVSPAEINCELFGQRASSPVDDHPILVSDLTALPAATLAAWAGPVDFKEIARGYSEGRFGTPETLAGLFLEVFTMTRGADSIVDQLGPTCRLVVALDPAASGAGFDLPAFTVLIDTRKRTEIIELLDGLTSLLTAFLKTSAVPPSADQSPEPVKKTRCEDVELHSIEIGPALADRLRLDFLRKVEFAWAYVGDALLLSTSRAHAEQVIRAARRKAPRLDDSPDAAGILPPPGDHGPLAECFYLRGAALSSMLSNWMEYLGRHHPQTLAPKWWRSWAGQRVHQRDKLGLALRVDPTDPRRAIVMEVESGSPAAASLQVGDIITTAAGSPLTSADPAQEVAQRYQERGEITKFALEVIREGKPVLVTLEVSPAPSVGLTDFDPLRGVRQIATLSQHADAVTIWRFVTRKDRLEARVRVHWKQPGQ